MEDEFWTALTQDLRRMQEMFPKEKEKPHSTGSFRVDLEDRSRKMKSDSKKIWAHRRDLIQREVFDPIVPPVKMLIIVCIPFIISSWFWNGSQAAAGGIVIFLVILCFGIIWALGFVIWEQSIKPVIGRIRDDWNP